MSKILFVSSAVQAVLMSEVFIPELIDGFWNGQRPAGHGEMWKNVEVKISEDGVLGPVGFISPRNYNFLNLDFVLPNEKMIMAVAKKTKQNCNFKSIKKELLELSAIVGGRLSARDAVPLKLFRGNHREGTITVSSAKARQALVIMVAASETGTTIQKQIIKKTMLKKPVDNTVITKTSNGSIIKRVPVNAGG